MKQRVLVFAAALLMFLSVPQKVLADNTSQSTSYTMTKTVDGEIAVSQDAYTPLGTYSDLGLDSPQDLYVGNGKLYIADTGNKRALVLDIASGEVMEIGDGLFGDPRGISADEDGRIYVADTVMEKAYRFSKEGKLEFTFEKPTEPSYGKNTSFKPSKIAPADEGGVYLVCEGSKAGVVQISGYGNFLGYFASNNVNMSAIDKIIDSVLTEKQKSMFLKKVPASFENVFRGRDKLIYTINKGSGVKPKKHSINGLDMLSKYGEMSALNLNNAVDMHVTENGRIFVLTDNGQISEITADGYFLCAFGGYAAGTGRVGLFDVPAGMGLDEEGNVYVLDRGQNNITVFSQTPVQANIYEAIDLYRNGLYDESQKLLDNVLKYNDASYLAHIYSAKNYMQKADYENAKTHFEIAGDKNGYSEAYWEIRNMWLQKNLGYIILAGVILFILYQACRFADKKTGLLKPLQRMKEKIKGNRFMSDLGKMSYVMRHPIDGAYYIKTREIGSIVSATFIYVCLFVLLVLYQTATGFIFAQPIEGYSILNVFLAFLSLLVLFISVHYLISSINEGLGTPRSIYITLAYSFSPLVLVMPFIIIISNFATINDQFFLLFAIGCLLAWSICNVVTGFIQMHDYKFWEMIRNFLVTFFTIGVAILGISVVYLMVKQIFSFLYDIMVEVSLRV